MDEESDETEVATSFKVNWPSESLSLNVNNKAILSTAAHSYSTQEHGGQFSRKVLPSRIKLRSQTSAKFSPLGHEKVAEKKLREAAQWSKVETLLQLVNYGVSVSSPDSKKRTALHFAAAQGNEQTLRILLEHGANPNAKDLNGNTPLHLAACTNHLRIVTLLLQAGAKADATDFSGKTPLDLACSRLRVLHGDHCIRGQPSIYCEEVKQVIELIKAYMLCLGNKQADKTLQTMTTMLETSTTTEEVDEVHDLLTSFTAMSLSKSAGKDNS